MEFEDKNVKTAVKKAAKTLKIEANELKYEVISYGSTGIFGLVGAKKAKIRVTLPKEEAPVETEEKEVKTKDLSKEPVVPDIEEPEKAAETPEAESPVRKEAVETGRRVLQKILDKITDGAEIEIKDSKDILLYDVKGGNAAVLIGKRGQTLEAIQYIVERTVNKHSEKRIRLQIDVAGYLENRKVNLEQRAQRLAEKVQKIGKPVTVGEMNVYDRKIVHLTLKDNRNVRTQSMGNGFYRKLVIFPKKGGGRKRARN